MIGNLAGNAPYCKNIVLEIVSKGVEALQDLFLQA